MTNIVAKIQEQKQKGSGRAVADLENLRQSLDIVVAAAQIGAWRGDAFAVWEDFPGGSYGMAEKWAREHPVTSSWVMNWKGELLPLHPSYTADITVTPAEPAGQPVSDA